jgi:hypothetical protein
VSIHASRSARARSWHFSWRFFFFGFLGFILPLEEKKKEDRGPKKATQPQPKK